MKNFIKSLYPKEKLFEGITGYQHILRKGTNIDKLKKEGFNSGIGPNVLPRWEGKPTDIMQMKYEPKAGDTILYVPKEWVRHTPNGPKIKDGYIPKDEDIVRIECINSMNEAYEDNSGKRKSIMMKNFIKSLKRPGNEALIESVLKGYKSIFESIQYPPNFDVQELKKLNNFAARVRYVQTHLKKIGSGSARIVYEIDDKHVLKLAKNKKGIAQNVVEGDWGLHRMYDGILPDLIEKDDDDLWLIVERANKISKKEFERLTGVKFENFARTLGYELSLRSSRNRGFYRYKPEDYDDIIDNEFLSEIVDMSINFDMPAGDFERISTYGKVDDDPVVVDPGLTQSVYEEHYR